ncbi:hypothetical protein H8B15_06690 [Hymenobacter sp. BT507]|uniref:Nucleotidyltransferase family protein n=1 Tax=Hymenobacter citatus TaxID=2763506 RepID=A0ABR7MHS0_9BACT|nr:hypothetical protein [Hymenobacter citatus]MBC6610601.1 hypothetical protein [Hymenobacter citatus]
MPESRPTDDVDCVIDLASYPEFTEVEERLRQRGFQHDQSSGIQIRCLWKGAAETYTVDIMPADGGVVLGSTVNQWYKSGIATSQHHALPLGGPEIMLLDAPHFIATKLEAMKGRATDLRWSQDWEDIIYVVETRGELLDEIQQAPENLRQFIASYFAVLIAHAEMNEWLEAIRDPASSLSVLWKRCQALAALQ